MTLYKTDFQILSDDDRALWEQLQQQEIIYSNGKPTMIKKSLYRDYPKSVRHYISLFPNFFIDAVDLKASKSHFDKLLKEFEEIITDPATNERMILNHIRDKKAYFLLGGILKKYYHFGHHAMYIFPEFQMPPNYRTDYLLVGKNSDGYHFIFVELEAPHSNITLKDGTIGETIRKGTNQIDFWEVWLEGNFSHLTLLFEQYKNPTMPLPKEFTSFDKSRIHFVVVAGRRKDFSEMTYRLRRAKLEQQKLNILHYDNLIDGAKEAIGTDTY